MTKYFFINQNFVLKKKKNLKNLKNFKNQKIIEAKLTGIIYFNWKSIERNKQKKSKTIETKQTKEIKEIIMRNGN